LPNNTYLLNLLVDMNQTNGVFSPDQPGAGLTLVQTKSATWLKLLNQVPGPGFNPETANWINVGKERNFLIRQALGDSICVRVSGIPALPLDPAANVTLVTSFGAPRIASQVNSSPFQTPGGQTTAAFSFGGGLNSPAPGPAAVAWFFELGRVALAPANQHVPHRYEFSVGAIVTSLGVTQTFGIDPEMDVGL
jgi:hypothetical protein